MTKNLIAAFLIVGGGLVASGLAGTTNAAFAQQGYRTDSPNLRNFYMARQQIQIIDDSPIINNQTGDPGAAAGLNQRQPLPKAGFGTFIPSRPMNMGPLPKVENGVPRAPLPSASNVPGGMKANAGKLKIKTPAKATAPAAPKAYKPYQGYGGAPTGAASTARSSQTTTSVKGDVLHWARNRKSY